LSCDLTWFDAVILHSDLLPKDGAPSHSELGHAIRSYDGPKMVLVRDEAVLKARSHVLRHLRIEASLSEFNDVVALVRTIESFVDGDVFKPPRTELIEVPIQSEDPEKRGDILIHLNDPALTVAPREESRKTPRSSVSLDSEENVTVRMVWSSLQVTSRGQWLRGLLVRASIRALLSVWVRLPKPVRDQIVRLLPPSARQWLRVRGAWPALY